MVVEYPIEGDLLPEDIEHFTLVTVLHELAHILDRPAPFQDRTGEDPLKLQFESLVVANSVAENPPKDLPPYFGHAISFIRACLHLRYRVKLTDLHIVPSNLCAGWQYQLSHALAYEPVRMVDATFREILSSLPPQPFHDLWLADSSRATATT